MKRFLLLLLALACVLAMVACDDEKKDSSKKEEDESTASVPAGGSTDESAGETNSKEDASSEPEDVFGEEDARELLEGCMDAFLAFDTDTLKSYCHDSDDFSSSGFLQFEKLGKGDFGDIFGEDMALFAGHEDKVQAMMQALVDKMKASMSYEVGACEHPNETTYLFEVDVTVVDPDTVGTLFTQQLSESFSQEAMTELVLELFANGTITESTSETELYSILIPIILDMMTEALMGVEFPTTVISGQFAVTQKNDVWLNDIDYEGVPGLFV